MSQATVVERKHAFLRRQKHILTKPIPSSNRIHQIAEYGGIQEKVLRDVLLKGWFALAKNSHEIPIPL
jgi:hypothetical protein